MVFQGCYTMILMTISHSLSFTAISDICSSWLSPPTPMDKNAHQSCSIIDYSLYVIFIHLLSEHCTKCTILYIIPWYSLVHHSNFDLFNDCFNITDKTCMLRHVQSNMEAEK